MAQQPTSNQPDQIRVSPLFNNMFLYLFGKNGSESLTRSLLNAVLKQAGLPVIDSIDEIDEITADATIPGGVQFRTARCDIVVVTRDGVYDIEAQGRHTNVANKSLFYSARLFGEHMPAGAEGDNYDNAPQVVVITLLHGRKLFPRDKRFLTRGSIHWELESGCQPATDRMLFIVVEMDKVSERYNSDSGEISDDESLAWLYLLAKGYASTKEVETMSKQFPSIEEFAELYGMAVGDKHLKNQYEAYIRDVLDYNTTINEARRTGHAEGRAEGIAEGWENGVHDVAEALRAFGVDEAAIQKALESLKKA
ncbi:MAG: PD-(D/E)XK nuclease family transposase [Coriobacteriia bacterium]|nr:PD-(D/E)XK nuclease family transposase [Coriobacteriia bacterium]